MSQDATENRIGAGKQTVVLRVVMGGKSDRDWRDRIREFVAEARKKKDRRNTPRQISIRAAKIRSEKGLKTIKQSDGYVWSLIRPGSTIDPPMSYLESVAEAMGLRLVQLLEEGAESPRDYALRQKLKRAPDPLKNVIEAALDEAEKLPE